MTQEDKDLLVRDLCARLPYGTMIQAKEWATVDTELKFGHIDRLIHDELKLKPYLRSLSSMTEEEYDSIRPLLGEHNIIYKNDGGVKFIFDKIKTCKIELIDWLNKNMFDYHGLIEKGLALEAPEGMYMHLKT